MENNKKQDLKKLRKETKIIEKAIESFLQKAIESVSEKDFVFLN